MAAINSGKSGWSDMATWDVSGITDFSGVFNFFDANRQDDGWDGTVGEIPIQDWDVSNGENFYQMFAGAADFNGDVSTWDVSQGTNFGQMFYGAEAFNGDVSKWAVSSGTEFGKMFYETKAFKGDVSKWDVSHFEGTDFEGTYFEIIFKDSGFCPAMFCKQCGPDGCCIPSRL